MSILKLRTRVPTLLAAAALGAAVPGSAVAQGIDLVPWAGVYVPTSNKISSLGADLGKRDVSAIGGARLTFWGSGHLGFEVTGGYAPAKISGETINEGNTDLLTASGRLMLALSPADSKVGFFLAGGPALLTRGSNPFNEDRSRTDFGGNVGLGFRFGLGESNSAALRLDFEDYFYNGDFGGGNDFQNDLVGSLGLAIPLGGHSEEQ